MYFKEQVLNLTNDNKLHPPEKYRCTTVLYFL